MSARRPRAVPSDAPPRRDAQAALRTAPQVVRLIGGRFKRTPLPVPTWPGLRPTASRVRETLFNWLGQDLGGWRVLDAFAGSGALGLEAASRGAAPVVLLEREAVLVRHLQATVFKLKADGVNVLAADAVSWMDRHAVQHPGGAFDLVLLDPPFDAGLFEPALRAARGCVPLGGWIYLEASLPCADVAPAGGEGIVLPPGLRLHRHGRAGAVHYHLIERVDGPATPAPAQV